MCPVQALDHVVHIILQYGGTIETLICAYKQNDTWEHVQSADMIVVVCTATKQLKLHHQGIDPDLVGSHSRQAGGAMTLKRRGYDDTTIKNSVGELALHFYNISTIKSHISLRIFPKK